MQRDSFIWPGTSRAEPDFVARRQKARLLPAAPCRWRFAPFGKPAGKEPAFEPGPPLWRRELQGGARLVHGVQHDGAAPDALHIVEDATAALEVQPAAID